jgi:propanol-preferring alcohol dehydrogenase
MSQPADRLPFELPMTLGHEPVGTVAALGDGVSGFVVGDAVAVYIVWGCGHCVKCRAGQENYCLNAGRHVKTGPGMGYPGALATFMVVDSVRHLVPIGDLDFAHAAPLTDAGMTPYHAITRALGKLVPGSAAIVIGIGGLGHMAVQILRAVSAARVIALDVSNEKLAMARELGAHVALLSDADAVERVRGIVGEGAQAVFDFVGNDTTVAMAARMVAADGHLALVGMGGGTLRFAFGRLPFGVTADCPFAGTGNDLVEVIALVRAGMIDTHIETFPLDEAPHAYELLHAGKINGRAVVVIGD